MNIIEGVATPAMSTGQVVNAYVQEARAEVLRYLRLPGFLLPTMLFPSVFYLMFGIFLARQNSPDAARYLLASYGTFGVMAPGLFGFGVSLAIDREHGLLTLKRALPMPPGAYLVGKMCMALIMASVITTIMLCLAIFGAHVQLGAGNIAQFFVTEVLGVLAFCSLGLLLGTLAKGQSAPGMVNLIYLPMAFLSGLWFPLSIMPQFLQAIAPVWPAYHLDQLALSAIGMGQGGELGHVAVLVGFTAVFLYVAGRRLARHG
jgi:ABC-type multidrug transport system, permease component